MSSIGSGKRSYRTHLGPKFSEGARLLWTRLAARKISPAEFARIAELPRASLFRWMFGDTAPGRDNALVIERELGIAPELFSKPPKRAFTPPAADAA